MGRAQAHDSAATLDKVVVWEEDRRVSRYAADLPQLAEGLGRWGRQACPFFLFVPSFVALFAAGHGAATWSR